MSPQSADLQAGQKWHETLADAHRVCGLSKLIDPARRKLGWEGFLHGDLPGGTPRFGIMGWAGECTPPSYAPIT